MKGAVFLIAGYGFYNIYSSVIDLTESKFAKLIAHMNPVDKKSLRELYMYHLRRFFSSFIKLKDYKVDKLRKKLDKVGKRHITPQEHVAEMIIVPLTFLVPLWLLYVLKSYLFLVPTFLIAFASTLNKINELDEKIAKINKEIEVEIPTFIRSFAQALEGEKDIIKIIERYRKICGKAFEYDLDVLITDLKTGNNDEALSKFDNRLNIPVVSAFVSGVLQVNKGVDQKTFFYVLNNDLKVMAKENLNRLLEKRPRKVKFTSIVIIFCFLLLTIYPLIIQIIRSLKFLN